MSVLKIGGVEMPSVQKLSISREPIWSKNAGRSADASMVGDIVGHKIKLKITFNPMSDADAAKLDAAIYPAFFNVTFRNPISGNIETKTMYAGTPTYPVYSYVDSLPRYNGVAVDLVEQ